MLPTNCGSTRGRVAAKRPGGVRCLLNHCIAFFATGLLVLPQAVHAEYPDRPIRIVSPWPAGGSGDLVARVFADFLARKTGAAVVVENRTGGNGGIGSTAVARAAPDGYTLLVTTSEPLTINPTVSGDLQYVVARDFDPIALIARTHFVVVAQAAFAPNDMQQLIANARANPGKVTAATYGIASLFVPYFESLTGTQFLKVPYQGAAPATAAVLSGTVDFTIVATSTAGPVREKAKLLGVSSATPVKSLPGVRPFADQGLAEFRIGNWIGLLGPRGIPPDARQWLVNATQSIVESPDFRAQLGDRGIDAAYGSPAELITLIDTESARWSGLIRERDLHLN